MSSSTHSEAAKNKQKKTKTNPQKTGREKRKKVKCSAVPKIETIKLKTAA